MNRSFFFLSFFPLSNSRAFLFYSMCSFITLPTGCEEAEVAAVVAVDPNSAKEEVMVIEEVVGVEALVVLVQDPAIDMEIDPVLEEAIVEAIDLLDVVVAVEAEALTAVVVA